MYSILYNKIHLSITIINTFYFSNTRQAKKQQIKNYDKIQIEIHTMKYVLL